MDPKDIKHGALIELRDIESDQWLPLSIVSIASDKVECRMLTGESIFTTTSALITNARLRPRDGSCRDCGDEAHDGSCVDRQCSECGARVSSQCFAHPLQPVHVYKRRRYLAEIVEDKPYPTRDLSEALRRDLMEQIQVLRNATEVRQNRFMITGAERVEIMSALGNAAKLIEALPSENRRSR
jgi:hypothetical protein